MITLQRDFVHHLEVSFPGLKTQPLATLVSENLLSPFVVRLPRSLLAEIQTTVGTLFALREKKEYLDFHTVELARRNLRDPGNKSIAMSYDFHVTADQKLKLIEVNTNAAFLAMGHEMYRHRGMKPPVADFSMAELRACIEEELRLQGKNPRTDLRVQIMDESPEQQRLYIEFLLYHELFKSWGWNSAIKDVSTVSLQDTDFIYNRATDFYFEGPAYSSLRQAFLDRRVCFSPNPFEYFLLADKQRLIEWSAKENLTVWKLTDNEQARILGVVPRSLDIHADSQETVWSQRKHLFFKPKRAFGSKQTYRGSSISRKAFEEILGGDFIAQEYVPAPEVSFETPSGPQSFKYDLRCYAYQGRLQLVVARLYQGQVTNLRTPLGGFACVEFYRDVTAS